MKVKHLKARHLALLRSEFRVPFGWAVCRFPPRGRRNRRYAKELVQNVRANGLGRLYGMSVVSEPYKPQLRTYYDRQGQPFTRWR